jgi:hypothetical protein
MKPTNLLLPVLNSCFPKTHGAFRNVPPSNKPSQTHAHAHILNPSTPLKSSSPKISTPMFHSRTLAVKIHLTIVTSSASPRRKGTLARGTHVSQIAGPTTLGFLSGGLASWGSTKHALGGVHMFALRCRPEVGLMDTAS